jgi:hypothetical protein
VDSPAHPTVIPAQAGIHNARPLHNASVASPRPRSSFVVTALAVLPAIPHSTHRRSEPQRSGGAQSRWSCIGEESPSLAFTLRPRRLCGEIQALLNRLR